MEGRGRILGYCVSHQRKGEGVRRRQNTSEPVEGKKKESEPRGKGNPQKFGEEREAEKGGKKTWEMGEGKKALLICNRKTIVITRVVREVPENTKRKREKNPVDGGEEDMTPTSEGPQKNRRREKVNGIKGGGSIDSG